MMGEHVHRQMLAGKERDRKLIEALSAPDRALFDALSPEMCDRVVVALRWHPEPAINEILAEIRERSIARAVPLS
jgi:hypothetical protein